jgi:hypothetical protein
MNMGTIASLCLYDAAVRHALQSVNLRQPAISRYALPRLFHRYRETVRRAESFDGRRR